MWMKLQCNAVVSQIHSRADLAEMQTLNQEVWGGR